MDNREEQAVLERTLTQVDFDRFAALSGDDNPIHVDAQFSARTRFGRTVAHGFLLNTVLRGLVGELVPHGRQISQDLCFPAPTYADEPMRFSAQVTGRNDTQTRIRLVCTRIADGVITCEGDTVLEPTAG